MLKALEILTAGSFSPLPVYYSSSSSTAGVHADAIDRASQFMLFISHFVQQIAPFTS